MRVRVKGGTVQHDQPSLCSTCRHVVEMKGPTLSDHIVLCGRLRGAERAVPFAVMSCSDYEDRSQPSLYRMEEIAWVLRSDPSKSRIVGFVRASELSEDERHVL